MNIHEYQAKKIFEQYGIKIPKGKIAYTPAEAVEVAQEVSKKGPWVVFFGKTGRPWRRCADSHQKERDF